MSLLKSLLNSLRSSNINDQQTSPISNDSLVEGSTPSLIANNNLKAIFKTVNKINLEENFINFLKSNKLNEIEMIIINSLKTDVFNGTTKIEKSFKLDHYIGVVMHLMRVVSTLVSTIEFSINQNQNNFDVQIDDNHFELMNFTNWLLFMNHCNESHCFDFINLIWTNQNGFNQFNLEFNKTKHDFQKVNIQNQLLFNELNSLIGQLTLMNNVLNSKLNKLSLQHVLTAIVNIIRIITHSSDCLNQVMLCLITYCICNKLIDFAADEINLVVGNKMKTIGRIEFTSVQLDIIRSIILKFNEEFNSIMKSLRINKDCVKPILELTRDSIAHLNNLNNPNKTVINSNETDHLKQDESDIKEQNSIENISHVETTTGNHQNTKIMSLTDLMKSEKEVAIKPTLFIRDEQFTNETDHDNSMLNDFVNSFVINKDLINDNNDNEEIIDDYSTEEFDYEELGDDSDHDDDENVNNKQNDENEETQTEERFDMIQMLDDEQKKEMVKKEMKNLHKGHNLTNPNCSDTLRMKFADERKSRLIPCDYEFSQMDQIFLMRMKAKFGNEINKLMQDHNLSTEQCDELLLANYKFKMNTPFKLIKVDINSLTNFAKSMGKVNKLIDLMCDQMLLLLIFELNDPQLRVIENSFNEIDTCICIDGIQRPFINIRDFENSVKTCLKLKDKPSLIEIKGDRYPIIDGIDLNTQFKGEPKSVDADPAKQSLQSLFNRCLRIVSDQKIDDLNVSDGFNERKIIMNKIQCKVNSMFDRTGHFQFKEVETYKPLLNTLQLSNMITLLLMLDETIHEVDSMLRLLRSINTIENARNKKFEKTYYEDKFELINNTDLCDDELIDDYVNVAKHKNDEMFIDVNGNIMSQDGPTMVKSNELRAKLWDTKLDDQRLLNLLLEIKNKEIFRYSKTYGKIKITVAAVKKHKTATERKYHFIIELIDGENSVAVSKVHLINMEKINNDIKNFRTLLHLRCLIDIRSVTYKMFDIYCRHPSQVKADMICSIEFARKHREGQLFCWKLLSNKFKSMELIPHNSTDLEMAFWCFISSLDECVHDQFAFSLFHAPNRQSPKEMISCYDAVLRETPLKDRLNSNLFKQFIIDLKSNLHDYFDKEKLVKSLNEPDAIDVNMFLSTASSTNLCLPSNYDTEAIHLLTGHVVKDFKFKVFDEALENSLSNLTLNQIMEMCTETTPVCSLTSKMNVKSVREIYVFDPITSIAASAESHIAQKISECSYSDVIMKETKKGEIISEFINAAIDRVKCHKSANIVVIEGDGKKFNQHMVLECFNEMYKAINDSINGNLNSEWFKYLNFFYSYYQRKQIVVKMKSYVECFCFNLIKTICYGEDKINEIKPVFKQLLNLTSKLFDRSSTYRIAAQNIDNSNFDDIRTKINSGHISEHEMKLLNNCHDGTKHELEYKLNFNKAINKLLTQYDQVMNSEFLSKYIVMLMNMCVKNVFTKFTAETQFEDEASAVEYVRHSIKLEHESNIKKLSTVVVNIVKMLKQSDLIIPTPFGMAQGILACSSSVYSSSCLKFTCKKLKEQGWFDTFECVATSDDLLVIATTSKEMSIEMQKELKISYGTTMSELGIPMNAIKTSVKVNPNRLSFNSVLYDCCNNKKSDYLVTLNKKLPCITRILKNIYTTSIDDHCSIYNQISTGLKELFSTIKFSLRERVKIIDNGRLIYARTEFVDYYHQNSSKFEWEFFQAWPSSKETVNSNSDYALFNRKEMDLLWFVRNAYYWRKLNLNNVINLSIFSNVKGVKFMENKLTFDELNSEKYVVCNDGHQLLIMEKCSKKFISLSTSKLFLENHEGKYKLKTKELNLEWFEIELNESELNDYLTVHQHREWFKSKFENMVEIDDLQAIYNDVTKDQIISIKNSLTDENDPIKIYYLFIKWFGNNLEVTSDPLGFRIRMKHFDKNIKLLDIVSKIDEMKTCNVQNVMNLFSHLGENYREQLPHNLILKVQGTPHIPENTFKYNYTFNNCEPIIDQTWKIPMTLLTNSLLQLNPFMNFNYAFAVDDTSSSSIYDINPHLQVLAIEHEWKWKSELLSACIMMDYDKLYYRSEARQLLNGSIVPFIPNLTFNGCYGLPKVNETLATFLRRCKTRFDPWIVCQRRRSNQVYTDHGLLDDVTSNCLYYLNHHKIVWCCDRRTLIPKKVDMSSLPACIKHYEIEMIEEVKQFIDSYQYDENGKWVRFNKKCKSGKSRSLPMFNLSHYESMFSMNEMERKMCFKYNKKNIRVDETPSDKLRKLWLMN